MRTLVAALLIYVATAGGTPEVVDKYDAVRTPKMRELCATVREWKALMKRKYGSHDRSIPGMARICAMKDD